MCCKVFIVHGSCNTFRSEQNGASSEETQSPKDDDDLTQEDFGDFTNCPKPSTSNEQSAAATKCSKPMDTHDTKIGPSASRRWGLGAQGEEDPGDTVDDEEKEKFPKDIHLLLTAPTGKAANLLGKRAKKKAYTLHQVIFSYRLKPEGRLLFSTKR